MALAFKTKTRFYFDNYSITVEKNHYFFITYGENDNKAVLPQFFPIEQWSNELFLEKSIESGKHITHKAQLEVYKAHYHIITRKSEQSEGSRGPVSPEGRALI